VYSRKNEVLQGGIKQLKWGMAELKTIDFAALKPQGAVEKNDMRKIFSTR